MILGVRGEQHGGELKRFAFGVSAAVTSAALPGIGSWVVTWVGVFGRGCFGCCLGG